jgi:hypothetical protein
VSIYELQSITSLEGFPEFVESHLSIIDCNNLKSLKGIPKQVGQLTLNNAIGLTELDYLPDFVHSTFVINNSKVSSLKDIHKKIKAIGSVLGGTVFEMRNSRIKSNVLGLLLIEGVKSVKLQSSNVDVKHGVDLDAVEVILNKYLPNTRGRQAIIECQKELIEAGLEEYAKL